MIQTFIGSILVFLLGLIAFFIKRYFTLEKSKDIMNILDKSPKINIDFNKNIQWFEEDNKKEILEKIFHSINLDNLSTCEAKQVTARIYRLHKIETKNGDVTSSIKTCIAKFIFTDIDNKLNKAIVDKINSDDFNLIDINLIMIRLEYINSVGQVLRTEHTYNFTEDNEKTKYKIINSHTSQTKLFRNDDELRKSDIKDKYTQNKLKRIHKIDDMTSSWKIHKFFLKRTINQKLFMLFIILGLIPYLISLYIGLHYSISLGNRTLIVLMTWLLFNSIMFIDKIQAFLEIHITIIMITIINFLFLLQIITFIHLRIM